MPKFIVNEYGVIVNPEIITICTGKLNSEVIIRIAEVNNFFYTGYLNFILICKLKLILNLRSS